MEMKIIVTVSEMIEKGTWQNYCFDHKIEADYVSKYTGKDTDISLTEDEARKYGILESFVYKNVTQEW